MAEKGWTLYIRWNGIKRNWQTLIWWKSREIFNSSTLLYSYTPCNTKCFCVCVSVCRCALLCGRNVKKKYFVDCDEMIWYFPSIFSAFHTELTLRIGGSRWCVSYSKQTSTTTDKNETLTNRRTTKEKNCDDERERGKNQCDDTCTQVDGGCERPFTHRHLQNRCQPLPSRNVLSTFVFASFFDGHNDVVRWHLWFSILCVQRCCVVDTPFVAFFPLFRLCFAPFAHFVYQIEIHKLIAHNNIQLMIYSVLLFSFSCRPPLSDVWRLRTKESLVVCRRLMLYFYPVDPNLFDNWNQQIRF